MNVLRVLLLGLSALCGSALAQERQVQTVPADRIVAVVNDEVLTQHELSSRLLVVERQLRQQGTPPPSRDVLQRQLLERMIIDRLQLQFAKDTGLRVDDAQLDQALGRIAQSNRMDLADFRAALEKDGVA